MTVININIYIYDYICYNYHLIQKITKVIYLLSVQVSSNGLLSFGTSFNQWTPEAFPLSSAIIVAPFWDDIHLTQTGVAQYNVITSASNSTIIDQVESFLKTNRNVELDLNWVLVAKWVNVCPYDNNNCTSIQASCSVILKIVIYSFFYSLIHSRL